MITSDDRKQVFCFRPAEFRLLILAGIIVAWMFFQMVLVRYDSIKPAGIHWLLLIGFLLSAFVCHVLMVIMASRADSTILPLMVILVGFGMSYQYRLGSLSVLNWRDLSLWALVASPLLATVIGIILRKNRISILAGLFWFAFILSLGLPLLVIFTGVDYRGSLYGPAKTTPTEFVKPAMVIIICTLLWKNGDVISRGRNLFSSESMRFHGKLLLFWGLPQVLFAIQRDLGMVIVSGLLLIFLMWVVSKRKIYLFLGTVFVLVSGFLFKTFMIKGQARFEAWLMPFDHPATTGYQIIQSLFAMFHGEIFGRGIGLGTPSKIPLVTSDFIYASIAEEIGLAGSCMIMFAYIFLSWRCYRCAERAHDEFQSLAVIACGTLLWTQILLNIGGVIKMIPMTGVPLPFISFGGSACLTYAILLGWVLAVSDK
jgi:cell division protein FtsW (lipid II flippase)